MGAESRLSPRSAAEGLESTEFKRNLQEIGSQILYVLEQELDNEQGGVPRAVTTAMHAVLIVEDDSDVRDKLCSLFEANGFRVAVAETASHGLRAARVQRPDVVVVNLKLRDMDGTRFVRELRAWSMVPLIAMSPRHADRVVMRRTLLTQVWGPNQSDSRSLRVCIRNLRRKLQEEPGCPHHLVTEAGRGYRLVTHLDT